MSAWFVLSSLGFYQVSPSISKYDIGTPLFKEAKINLENGKSFIIKAPNVSPTNIYIKSVKLNGKDQYETFFRHSDIQNGGIIECEMSDKPNETWFGKSTLRKVEVSDFLSVPIIETKEHVFKDSTTVSIKSNSKYEKIIYSIDGKEPSTEYIQPFTVDKDTIIKSVSLNSRGEKSQIVESKVHKLPHDWSVKLFSKYNRQYTGGGEIGLIDGKAINRKILSP
jgi:Glycosyl hydrolase family 92/Chitobiase/beta-hexosaminidase C-terminal domain